MDIIENKENDIHNVLVFGETGCGKSTTLNYLYGKNMKIISAKQERQLVCEDNDCFKIGYGGASITQNIESKYINGYQLIDGPGLFDTQGLEARLNYLLQLEKFFCTTKNIKFALVLDIKTLTNTRRQGLILILDRLNKLVGGDLDRIKDSTILIVNKLTEQIDEESISELLEMILDALKNSQKEDYISFFNYIYSNKRIFGLQMPQRNQIGQFFNMDQRDEIFRALSETSSINIDNKFKLFDCLDDTSKMELQEIKKNLRRQLIQNDQNISELIKEKLLYTVDYSQLYRILKINIENENSHKEILKQILELSDQVQDVRLRNMVQQQEEYITKLIDKCKFIEEEYCKEEEYKSTFSSFKYLITYHIRPLYEQSLSIVVGTILTSSLINKKIIQNNDFNTLNTIVINTEKFIFNSDITYEGKTIMINCRNLIVDGESQVVLSGKKGEDNHEVSDTLDGLPGKPGQNGGNLIIRTSYAISFANQYSKLIINISGGMGGDGQAGQNGQNGKDGEDSKYNQIQERSDEFLVERKNISSKLKEILSFNSEYEEIYIAKGTDGERGQDGGRGGHHGMQGYHGQVYYYIHDKEQYELPEQIKLIKTILIGIDGAFGAAGIGGMKGRYMLGIYREEYFCPSIRRIKEKQQPSIHKKQKVGNKLIITGNVAVGATGMTLRVIGLASINSLKFISGIAGLAVTGVQVLGSTISAISNGKWENMLPIQSEEHAESGQTFVNEKNDIGIQIPQPFHIFTLEELNQIYENIKEQLKNSQDSYNILSYLIH